MTEPATVAIDESILDSYRMLQEDGKPDVVTEFIDVFLEDLPARVEGIRNALTAGDPSRIRSAAHSLKGSSSSIGAVRLSGCCAKLEALGKAGSTQGAHELFVAIEAEAGVAREALRPFRQV